MRTSYDLTKIIAMTAYQETAPFPRPISSLQLKKYLFVTNLCWLLGLIVIGYTTIAVANFAWTQRAERVAEAEHSQALQEEITRLAELHQYTSAQTMQLAKSIQAVLDTADNSIQRRFLVSILPEALRLQTLYRIPVSALIGQAIYESGYGTSPLTKYHNYFGMKAQGDDWNGAVVEMPTKDSGQRTVAKFRAYRDMKSGIEGYAIFLRTKDRYSKAFELRSGSQFVATIAKAGYCPDSNYASQVSNIIARHKLANLDLPQELPTPSDSTVPQVATTGSATSINSVPAAAPAAPMTSQPTQAAALTAGNTIPAFEGETAVQN
jgi:flagellum-specific peptidoglycan hydrolase FlgJ